MSLRFSLVLFYITCSVVTYFSVISTGNYGFGVNFKSAPNFEQLTIDLLLWVIPVYFIVYLLYSIIVRINFKRKIKTSSKLSDVFALICIVINSLTIFAGIGSAGGDVSRFGFLQSLLPLIPCLILYYGVSRDDLTRGKLVIIIIMAVLALIKGWSGHIIIMVILEVLYRYNDRLKLYALIKLFLLFCFVLFLFYFIMPLKFTIRGGVFHLVPIAEYIDYVFGRVAIFSLYSYLSTVSDRFYEVISSTYISHFYLQEFFLGIIPKSLVGMSDFRGMDNVYSVLYINPDLINAGFSITLPGLVNLSSNNIIVLLGFVIFVTLVFIFQWSVLSRLCNSNTAKNVQFVNMLLFIGSGSLKSIAMFSYLLVIFVIYMWFFRRVLTVN
ncbi:oligosaccharide repeat unit polymerase [Vibrio furnissii]|uniref:oligosaccharide repeat unit polymerase n=1 Tax=Vibrio furnissii TaxID=29494 RepID=UPI0015585D3E|nr:oligosaccharide repeat unit polymerase [Vibrio furnissii]